MPALSPRPLIGVAEATAGYVSALQKFVTLLSSYDDWPPRVGRSAKSISHTQVKSKKAPELFLNEFGDANLAVIYQVLCDVVVGVRCWQHRTITFFTTWKLIFNIEGTNLTGLAPGAGGV